jgi:rhamnose utilization protein RhaD (predicted bifunctional aldolase and dehydrogenase)/NAD(P)-dependent dehydrogenase (short-subunit alcohol dehydrogenase family)
MKSSWNDEEAHIFGEDPLQLRVYTSRLLGREPALVLHGGGNTSAKGTASDVFGDEIEVLYIKGSGWDLATIEAPGFAAVRLDVLQRMATLERLSDSDMVKSQRAAMLDPSAPNPSVEAILHAIIPFRYVDHTHADAVVTITNTPGGEGRIREIYGERVLVIPYVMPGFVLARKVHELTQGIDWSRYEGMVLMNHGLFTFGDDARTSYENTIRLVSEAEAYLERQGAPAAAGAGEVVASPPLRELARLRQAVSRVRGQPVLARLCRTAAAVGFSMLPNAADIATRGPLTPDHVIRNKRLPLLVDGGDIEQSVDGYARDYRDYFNTYNDGSLTCLQPAPAWAVWPGQGTLAFGRTMREAGIIADITEHTLHAIRCAEALGGWQALPAKDIFDVEYWELEQAKLGKAGSPPPLQGRIALVTGAASGIGKACCEALMAQGACVAALDIDPAVRQQYAGPDAIGLICDVTSPQALQQAVEATVGQFGGLDILVCNAGIFPASHTIEDMDAGTWQRSMDINLTSQQKLLQLATPYLREGMEPAVVVIGSKNVPAPGPGAGAYSVAKAALTQLARVAALELAGNGIRVNVVHPDAVFDTGIWTPEILADRARHYNMSIDEYRRKNLLKTEVTSHDVAALVCAMAGAPFAKTTGAQVPIDGGNERVI